MKQKPLSSNLIRIRDKPFTTLKDTIPKSDGSKLYHEEDVAEAVKKLKENIDSNYGIHKMCAIQAKKEIDKIMGKFDNHSRCDTSTRVVAKGSASRPRQTSHADNHSPLSNVQERNSEKVVPSNDKIEDTLKKGCGKWFVAEIGKLRCGDNVMNDDLCPACSGDEN